MKRPPLVRVRGIRQVIPSGHVLGRVSPGAGDAELIPISTLADSTHKSGVIPASGGASTTVQLSFHLAGVLLGNGQYFYAAQAPLTATFPTADTTVYKGAVCGKASTSTVKLYLVNNFTNYSNNGATGSPSGVIATFQFTSGNTTGTITWASGQPFTATAGDVLYFIIADDFADTAIEGITITLAGDYVSG